DYHTRKQQVLRVDYEPERRPEPQDSARLVEMVGRLSDWADAWIISDYGYHLISEEVLEQLRGERRKGKVVVADSRYRLRDLKGITLVTPNEAEAFAAFGFDQALDGRSEEVVASIGRRILDELGVAAALITRGDQG